MEDAKYNTARVDFEVTLQHSELFDWRVLCEYLTINIDSLSASEAIALASAIVEVLERMFP